MNEGMGASEGPTGAGGKPDRRQVEEEEEVGQTLWAPDTRETPSCYFRERRKSHCRKMVLMLRTSLWRSQAAGPPVTVSDFSFADVRTQWVEEKLLNPGWRPDLYTEMLMEEGLWGGRRARGWG